MSGKSKHQKKKLIRVFIEYGIHIWILIFITNIVVFYTFRFFLMASTENATDNAVVTGAPSPEISSSSAQTEPGSPAPSAEISTPTPVIPTPSPTAAGPVASLSFSLPGIGSKGSNFKPVHTIRNVDIYLYSSEVNTADVKVKPLYTIKTKAYYDDNPLSPTYTSFINNYIDLGKDIAEEVYYQVGFKTPQALMQLVKDPKSTSIGGKIYHLTKSRPPDFPHQDLITGDIFPIPYTDNIMDISDYNMLVDCFDEKAKTHECMSGSMADLDDNGAVDGTDYNLMLLSFQILKDKGFPIPDISNKSEIIINPGVTDTAIDTITPSATEKTEPSVTPINIPVKNASTGGGLIVGFFVFIIFLGIAAFAALKLHLLDKILKKAPPVGSAAPALSSNPQPIADSSTIYDSNPPAVEENTGTDASAPASPSPATPAETPANPAPPPAEIVPAPVQPEKTPVSPQQPGPASAPSGSAVPAAVSGSKDIVEKSGFLKKVKEDADKKGIWITIADDNGITRGFYKGAVTDGFVKVKGIMKTDEENKQYIEISELTPEE